MVQRGVENRKKRKMIRELLAGNANGIVVRIEPMSGERRWASNEKAGVQPEKSKNQTVNSKEVADTLPIDDCFLPADLLVLLVLYFRMSETSLSPAGGGYIVT